MQKNTRKAKRALLSMLLVAVVLVSTILAITVSASDTTSVGESFAADKFYDMQRPITPEGSITFETEVWTDPTSDADQYMMLGTFM